jgi:ASC-1-like (ASCH) protein
MANYHLVILKRPYLDLILEGKKTIESRFLKVNKAPFGQVRAGDVLLLKESSGPVCGRAVAEAVKFYKDLQPAKIKKIKERYNNFICGDEEYWQSKSECKFGVLVRLNKAERIEPVWITKKDWWGWVVLTDRCDFGLLKTQDARLKR